MKPFHLHVVIDNRADSVRFYSTMFVAGPSVQRQKTKKIGETPV